MSVVHANTVAAMSGHMLQIWGAKFQPFHRKMGLEGIFDQVMELVFNTAKQLQYAAKAWIVGPIGGGRFIRQSEYLRNLRLSRPLPILRGPRGSCLLGMSVVTCCIMCCLILTQTMIPSEEGLIE